MRVNAPAAGTTSFGHGTSRTQPASTAGTGVDASGSAPMSDAPGSTPPSEGPTPAPASNEVLVSDEDSGGDLEGDATQPRPQQVVRTIEGVSSAEIVITVRRLSGNYRHVDLGLGLVLAMASLIALLYLPQEFPLEVFPIDVALAFAVGVALCSAFPPLRRLL